MKRKSSPKSSVTNPHDVVSYSCLRQQSCEQCEFCKKKFTSRYSKIQHKACHLIFPILKLTLQQCDECLFHFSSLEDLRTHTITKNHTTAQFPKARSKNVEYEEILRCIVEKQVVVKCHDILSDVLPPLRESDSNLPVKPQALAAAESNSKVEGKCSEKEISVHEISSDSDESPEVEQSRDFKRGIRKQGNNNCSNSQCDSDKSNKIIENVNNLVKGQSNSKKTPENSQIDTGKSNIDNCKKNPDRVNNTLFSQHILKVESNPENGYLETETDPEFTAKKEEASTAFTDSIRDSSSSHIRELSSPLVPLQNRIIFEDEYADDDLFESDEILPDKLYHPPQQIVSNNVSVCHGEIVSNNQVSSQYDSSLGLNESQETECFESVHYDELMVPELCDCCYCGRCFGNRFELIKHESTHIRATLARPIICCVCEKYLAGNHWALRRHMQKYHPKNTQKLQVRRCKICNLNYHNYRRHLQYYHKLKCTSCNCSYYKEELQTHECIGKYNKHIDGVVNDNLNSYSVMKMCELCLAFAKNRQNIHYEVVGEISEVGKMQRCSICTSKYFNVILVRRMVRFREGTDFSKSKKPMSNKERLKKMQNRLKKMNKLNKC